MTNLFRKGMLEDLQMDPAVVQSMFPCVDELSEIHDRFLVQLLERRKESLATDSNKNFVINRLGDILVQQVIPPLPPPVHLASQAKSSVTCSLFTQVRIFASRLPLYF